MYSLMNGPSSLRPHNADRNGSTSGMHGGIRDLSRYVDGEFLTHLTRLCLRFRFWLLAIGHVVVFVSAYWLAYALRFDFQFSLDVATRFRATLALVVAIKLCIFYLTGHYHGWWRYVTLSDVWSLFKASAASLLLLVAINHYLLSGFIPRTVLILDALVATLLLGAIRASWRTVREHWQFASRGRNRRISLMIGANHWNGLIAHQIRFHPILTYRVVGFLDADEQTHGTRLAGIPVLGPPSELAVIAASCRATDVLVPADALRGDRLRGLMDACKLNRLTLKIVPSMSESMEGHRDVSIRDVEISDLLRRDPIELDTSRIAAEINQKTVLVTGAGGSIGSEICRQLLPFHPRRIVLIDNGENSLFLVHDELNRDPRAPELVVRVADIRDPVAIRPIFEEHRPDFVFHAAAHKHVALMESNVAACIKNNVLGTRCLADIALEYQISKFVLISTDKAVNPTSVMGVSKHLAERYVHALAHQTGAAFMVVRFGNVLGSNGSVVPLFQQQIRRGGPITVTDARMMRYFMTIPEASQLVLQSAAMGSGGEIFVLEMGDAIPVVELARDLIRLSGLPDDAIEIRFVGARRGEKLYEELYFNDEQQLPTSHDKVRAAYHRPYPLQEVTAEVEALREMIDRADETMIRRKLKELVPEYQIHESNDDAGPPVPIPPTEIISVSTEVA